jgi:hypothetical protein
VSDVLDLKIRFETLCARVTISRFSPQTLSGAGAEIANLNDASEFDTNSLILQGVGQSGERLVSLVVGGGIESRFWLHAPNLRTGADPHDPQAIDMAFVNLFQDCCERIENSGRRVLSPSQQRTVATWALSALLLAAWLVAAWQLGRDNWAVIIVTAAAVPAALKWIQSKIMGSSSQPKNTITVHYATRNVWRERRYNNRMNIKVGAGSFVTGVILTGLGAWLAR